MVKRFNVFLLVSVASVFGWLPAAPGPIYGWGAEESVVASTLTLEVHNEPLGNVLERISKTTHWKIEIPDGWTQKPVTQALNRAPLEEGLRSILNGAGIENLMLLYDETRKVVTVFDTESAQARAAARPPAQVQAQPQPFVSPAIRPNPAVTGGATGARPVIRRRGGSRANTAEED